MREVLAILGFALLAVTAHAEEPTTAISDETVAPDRAPDKAEATTSEEAPRKDAFVPPPGYRVKKFGDKVLYCMKDTSIGTRFKSERCYDEAQLKEFLAAQEQNKADIDRTRSICSNPGICAPQ